MADVDDDDFIAAVADTSDVLAGLARAYLEASQRVGHAAAADSPAMAELAAELRYVNDRWRDPIREAHAVGGMLTLAGCDHLRSYAHLFSSPPTPVYTHLVVARAALEAFGWARWLSDRQINVETRVKRGRIIQLADALQRKRYQHEPIKDEGRAIIRRVREGAPDEWLPIICNDRNIEIGGETAPTARDVIGAVLGAKPTAADELSASLWTMLSGVAHASRGALLMSMEIAPPSSSLAPPVAATITTASTVHLIGVVIARAGINACDERLTLMGWVDDSWRSAVNRADSHIHAVMEATAPRA